MKLWLKCWKPRSYFTFPFECQFMIPKLCIFVNSVGWKIAAVFSCLISQSYLHCLSPYCAIGHCTEGPQLFTKKPKHLKAVSVWPLGRACPFGHTTFSNVGVLLSNWASVHILLWCSILQLMQVNIHLSWSCKLWTCPYTLLWSYSRKTVVCLLFGIHWALIPCNASWTSNNVLTFSIMWFGFFYTSLRCIYLQVCWFIAA